MTFKSQDYSEFDKQLIALLEHGPVKFASLSSALEPAARAFSDKPDDELFRIVDRRLQALRKKNFVVFVRGVGWSKSGA